MRHTMRRKTIASLNVLLFFLKFSWIIIQPAGVAVTTAGQAYLIAKAILYR